MIVIKAITIGLFLYVSESVANICSGRWNGDQLSNPSDCSSFYVCSYGEPILFKCLDNLLYDPAKRVCNWAHMVDCGATGNQGHIPMLPNPPYYPEPQPEAQQPGIPDYGTQVTTNSPIYTAHPPAIVDVVPNIPDHNETDEFFPGLVELPLNDFHCTNPEFYFAPHPRICEKYFICENYRIHEHQCGEGIYWDYVYNQCDFPSKSFCYSVGNNFVQTSTSEPTTIAAEKGNLIECPGAQVFLGDPDDCRKYYICIAGNPIATSCPDKMAWDEQMSQCNEEAWSRCKA